MDDKFANRRKNRRSAYGASISGSFSGSIEGSGILSSLGLQNSLTDKLLLNQID